MSTTQPINGAPVVRIKWTRELLEQEAAKYKTRGEFAHGSWNAYVAANRRGITDLVCAHMVVVKEHFSWSENLLIKEAAKYKTKVEFLAENRKAYYAAYHRGILDRICEHMTTTHTLWSDEMLEIEAAKHQTRRAFELSNPNAYRVACRRNKLEDICGHMTALRTDWTFEMLAAEAVKYDTRSAFSKNIQSAYAAAMRMGCLDDICTHMTTGTTGYDPKKRGYFYALNLCDRHEEYIGFGISRSLKKRLVEHANSCSKAGFVMDIRHITYFEDGKIPQKLETHLKNFLPIHNTGISGFRSEATGLENEQLFYQEISNFFKDNQLPNPIAVDALTYLQNTLYQPTKDEYATR